MKPIVCVSSEGNDTKIVVLSKEKDGIKIQKTFSMIMSGGHEFNDPMASQSDSQSLKGMDADFNLEGIEEGAGKLASVDKNDVSFAANYFGTEELLHRSKTEVRLVFTRSFSFNKKAMVR